MTVFGKYDLRCFKCESTDYRIFASGLKWWRCKCNHCGWQWFTYGFEPPIPVNMLCIQMPLLTNGELILVKQDNNQKGNTMDLKICENCGHEKHHRYAFCEQCGHDNYETRKREAVEEWLGELLDMIRNIGDYADLPLEEWDIDHPDRDPKFEREIVEEAHGFIKHRDYKNLETVDWIELSPKGWYMATLTDAECEELYQEASEWLYNAT